MEPKLTPEMERWVAERVEAGEFASADEAVHAALLLLRTRMGKREERLDALRRDVRVGLDELDRGEGIDGDVAFDEVMDWIASRREQPSEAA